MGIDKAIHFFEEQKAVLEKHLKNGGEFAKEALEATNTALEALKKQVPRALVGFGNAVGDCTCCGIALDGTDTTYCDNCGQHIDLFLSGCIARTCYECTRYDINGIVCPYYDEKVDEIIRIHNEGREVQL